MCVEGHVCCVLLVCVGADSVRVGISTVVGINVSWCEGSVTGISGGQGTTFVAEISSVSAVSVP